MRVNSSSSGLGLAWHLECARTMDLLRTLLFFLGGSYISTTYRRHSLIPEHEPR